MLNQQDRPLVEGPPAFGPLPARVLLGTVCAALLAFCLWILEPFFASIAWATILVYVTWPAYRLLRKPLRSDTGAAFLMIAAVACVVVIPLPWLLLLLRNELNEVFKPLSATLYQGLRALLEHLLHVPWIGTTLQLELDRYAADPTALAHEAAGWLQRGVGALALVLGRLGRSAAMGLLTLIVLFFLYRDGDSLVRQLERGNARLFAGRLMRYAGTAGSIARGVFFGIVIAAAAQGVVAGIGYRIVDLKAPALLGAVTGILSIIPVFGTALVWVPIGIGLLVAGSLWKGAVLLAWGLLLVHPTDNVLRAVLVSNAARLPFLPVALGIIGGFEAFGLVGLFIGPILLGLALELWREWTGPARGA